MFDCLHDMGDRIGAARHVLRTLAPDGTWMSAGVDNAFGRNLQRLAEVKKAYDPDNSFNLNHNITPAR
jgi:FAD/FMN-containing dehydrogenase